MFMAPRRASLTVMVYYGPAPLVRVSWLGGPYMRSICGRSRGKVQVRSSDANAEGQGRPLDDAQRHDKRIDLGGRYGNADSPYAWSASPHGIGTPAVGFASILSTP
jgi:hypothetical protein